MEERKYSVGIWAYGNCCDRFCEEGYQRTKTFEEKVKLASETKGLHGIEVHHNGDFNLSNFKEAYNIISSSNLKVSAVNCNTFGAKEFWKGALTARDKSTRAQAIDIVKKAAEVAEYMGASVVNLWPGADGYDYSFQIDYNKYLDLMLNALKEIAREYPNTKFSLEYKIREPRIRSAITTVDRALTLINEIKKDNLGVTVDFGHSLQARENPAEAAVVASRYNKLFHVHLNDNSRDWDDDLIIGTYHLWETLEFVYYLKKMGYKGWLGFDMSPARENQVEAVEYSISTMERYFNIIEQFDEEIIQKAFYSCDALEARKYIEQFVFN